MVSILAKCSTTFLLALPLLMMNLVQRITEGTVSNATEMTSVLFEAILILDGIIPEVLHDPPKYVLKVSYGVNKSIEFGTELLPKDIKKAPHIGEWFTEENVYYCLTMTGMDEPRRENSTQFQKLYWFIGNIPESNFSAGHTYAQYMPPRPKKGTDEHRYVFILYKQPEKIKFMEPELHVDYDDARRTCFSTREFWAKYNVTPYATNFFVSAWNKTKS